jgi:membrane-bound lytic murein transglycosylase D
MQVRIHAALIAAFLIAGIAGCAGRQPQNTDPGSWSARDDTWTELRPLFGSRVYRPADAGAHEQSEPAPSANFDFSHPRVDDFLVQFQTRSRDWFGRALSRGGRYMSSMLSILEKEGVPPELVYLPIIESGFRTEAVSHAGAVGPWQFIRGTGQRYGLRIDNYVDERRDPIKSTRAAARYLKDLFEMFGDWHLSLAAYNWGENKISRILEKSQAEDYWEMSDRGYLCRETRDYVPKFLAALQMAGQPEAFGLDVPLEAPLRYEVVQVDRSLPLSTVAKLSDASTQEIKELNPALHRGVTPPQPYAVRVPEGSKQAFQLAYALFDEEMRQRSLRQPTRQAHVGSAAMRKHKVRRGETIGSIARLYQVPARALMAANGIRNPNRVYAGQTLNVPPGTSRTRSQVVAARDKGQRRIVD